VDELDPADGRRQRHVNKEEMKGMKSRGFGRRARLTVGGLLACALVAAAVLPSTGGAADEPILIGSVVGTTGAYGETGVSINRGAQIAVDYLNAHGGILGRKVKLQTYNDNAQATLAAQLFRRLVSAGAVVITGSSDAGPATAAEAARLKFPDVGIVDDGGPTIYAKGPGSAPNPWAYEFSINNYAMGEIFAKYALKKCPGGKLALLHDSTSYGVGASQMEQAVFKAAGKKLALDDTITENWTSGATVGLTSEIKKVQESGAKCVDVWLTPQDSAAFLKQAKQLGAKFTILGNDEYYATGTFLQLAGKLADGVISAEQATAVHPNAVTKAFIKQFNAKYHPPKGYNTTYAQATYDSLLMVAKAIEKKKSTKPSDIQAAMDATKGFVGATGILGFTKQNHQTMTADTLVLIQYDAQSKTWKPIKF
jgi:ABC-type branched-subunit amino acid transport system substrate-binding protein